MKTGQVAIYGQVSTGVSAKSQAEDGHGCGGEKVGQPPHPLVN